MLQTLKEKVAVVTGASAGIGQAIAKDLASHGASVVLSARRLERLNSLAAQIQKDGGVALVVQADAGDAAQIDALVEKALAWGGRLDIAVVNAGRGLAGGLLSSERGQWEAMYQVNVMGAAHLMRRAGEIFVRQGRGDIVALGSVAGHHISPFSGFYGSTKWAIAAVAEALRREVCGRGVRVTTIKPGIVSSEFQEVAGYGADFAKLTTKFGRVLEPVDVARAVSFIVSQPPHVHINELIIRPTGQDYP